MNKLKIFLSLCFALSSHQLHAFQREKGCLVENINTDMTSLHPHLLQDFSKMRVLDDIFEGLVTYNQKGEIVPGCAKSWDVLNEGKTYIFHLRENARWSNGDKLTAEDFVFSLSRSFKDLNLRALDKHTLEIRLEKPNNILLNYLCLALGLPLHRPSVEKFGRYYCSTPEKTVCNGAYLPTSFVHNGHIALQKNPYYWDEKNVRIEKVRFVMLKDAQTDMQAFNSGSIDITYRSLPTRGLNFYQQKYGDELHMYSTISQDLLLFNLSNEKFSETNVRKALAMAINKELYVDKIIKFGNLSCNPIPELFGPEFREIYEKMPEYRWTKEKFDKRAIDAFWLLDEFYTVEKPLHVRILYPISTFYKNLAEFIQNSWRKVFKGAVEVNIEAKTEKDLLERLQQGTFEICLYQKQGYLAAPINFTSHYVSDDVNNFSRYQNPDYDKIFSEALEKEEKDFLQDQLALSKILLQDFVAIPLFNLPVMKLINKDVSGFDGGKNILNRYKTKDLYFTG